MNLLEVADFYIGRILSSQAKSGTSVVQQSRVKAMLLDKWTVGTISMCTTQTELLEHEIYLVETIENQARDTMRHLRCLVYVKPTDETIGFLVDELRNPRYGEYYIFFNNTISKSQLERLAEADDLEVVSKVEEVFQDYEIINSDLFTMGSVPNSPLFRNRMMWDSSGLEEVTSSLISVLLSLKVRPQVRYDVGSKLGMKLAQNVVEQVKKNDKKLFDFPVQDSTPMLLILDRASDVVTPLLQPWTYQSLIYEYIGIKRNIVDLSDVPGLDESLKQVVLSPKQDGFFRDTMFLNFGDLGDRIKHYVSNYKDKTKASNQINTLEDIRQFVEKFPEFKKLSGNVSKHMAIVGELDRQLQLRHIWDISEIEQNISVHVDDSEDFQDLLNLVGNSEIEPFYKMKLACIFAARTNNPGRKSELEQLLSKTIPLEEVNFYHRFNSLFVSRKSNSAVRKDKDDILSELTKKFNHKAHQKSENVFMQHMPELSHVLDDLLKNKLSDEKYPNLGDQPRGPPQDVIIFFVGGVTFEEARVVHQFNESLKKGNARLRIILGGTSVLNTKEFISYCNDLANDGAALNLL
ncbi:LAMI_0D09824g1_1 [Lachancea mirantina]|uniref:LAMI_0D09824g1_1 n=1 Tax=Lachancea mirantina TaxID=1230905 RepID=A0A1G4JDQ4_9SACH|nr:LAMI_0D09824g1_1 [Lachancea mirantina]